LPNAAEAPPPLACCAPTDGDGARQRWQLLVLRFPQVSLSVACGAVLESAHARGDLSPRAARPLPLERCCNRAVADARG
jgi:hypothetical protein